MKEFSVTLTEEEWEHVFWHLYLNSLPCEVRDKVLNQLAKLGMEVIE